MEAIDVTETQLRLMKIDINNLKIEFKESNDILKAKDFSYVNPEDLDYIIDEQAKEFAKAGVDSILDIGKRNEKQ